MNKNIDTEITGIDLVFINAEGKKEYGLKLVFTENGVEEEYVMPKEEFMGKIPMFMDMFGLTPKEIENYILAMKDMEDIQEPTVLESYLMN